MKVSLVGQGDRWTEVGGTVQPSPQPLQLSLSSFIHQILSKHLLCTRLCHEGHGGCGPHHGDPSFHTLFLDRRPGGGPPNLDPLSFPCLWSRQDFLGLKFLTSPSPALLFWVPASPLRTNPRPTILTGPHGDEGLASRCGFLCKASSPPTTGRRRGGCPEAGHEGVLCSE